MQDTSSRGVLQRALQQNPVRDAPLSWHMFFNLFSVPPHDFQKPSDDTQQDYWCVTTVDSMMVGTASFALLAASLSVANGASVACFSRSLDISSACICDEECASGLCRYVPPPPNVITQGNMLCVACESDDQCVHDEYCVTIAVEVGNPPAHPYYSCQAAGSVGAWCHVDEVCASKLCHENRCLACKVDGNCHDPATPECDNVGSPAQFSCRPRSMVKVLSQKNVVNSNYQDLIAQGVVNPGNPDADTHSIVGNLDKDDFMHWGGRYGFQMRTTYQSGEESVFEWTQTSWLTEPKITGFVPELPTGYDGIWGNGDAAVSEALYAPKPALLILSLKDVADGLFTSGMLATGLENENNPEANAHSIIGTLHRGDLMHGSGYYMFKMHYKLLSGEEQLYTWRQSSWMTDSTVAGYTPVDIPERYPAFIGLHKSPSPYTYLRGSGGSAGGWYNPVGAVRVWGTGARAGIPVATIGSVDLVATSQKLYIYEPEQLKILSGSGTFPSYISNSGVVNPADPDAHQYSIIGKLDKDKFVHAGGFYKFKLHYEMSGGTEQVYVWTQTSWLTDPTVTGFVLIVGPPGSASPAFTGLGLSGTPDKTYLDTNGGVSHYYHAIGIIQLWNGGIPVTTTTVAVSQTLYVFPPQE